MNFMQKLFGGAESTPAPAATPATPAATPATTPAQPNPGSLPAAPTVASDPNNPTAPAPVASPMDQFSELWQPNAVDPNANQPLINIDPKQLAEAARKTDFAKIISPELMQRVQGGGEDGSAAMMQMLNQVAQGVYAQSAFATSKLVEQAVSKAREQFNADIPAHVKKLQVSDSLRTENPVFNHPAAAPILGAIESQLTVKYPSASASEITTMAKQYLGGFAQAVSAPEQAAEKAKQDKLSASKDTDWSTFLS